MISGVSKRMTALTDTERIQTLRQRCLARKHQSWVDAPTISAASLRASEQVESWPLRRGLLSRDRLSGARFDIDDCEMLAGRMRKADATPEQEQEAKKYLSAYTWPGGQTGHCELDLQELFAVGIAGLRSRIAAVAPPSPLGGGLGCASLPRHPQEDLGVPPKAITYRTFVLALDGLEAMILQAGQTAQDAMAGADASRRAELGEIADSCRRIATNPPQTFRDAIQLLWLADLATMHGDMTWLVVPGHIDRTLAPFYEADLAAGRITRDRALLLIESLYLLINEAVPDGLAMSVMVGGRDAAGRDLTNDLSYLCLEAIRRTKFIYPTVGICWHEGTPPGLVDLAVELVAKGYPTPAFFNDGTIQKGMAALGVPAGQACSYINSTCVEITPVGSSNVWVASPYLNLCQFLLDEIAEQATRDADVSPAYVADVPSASVVSSFSSDSSSQQQQQRQDADGTHASHADKMSASHEG